MYKEYFKEVISVLDNICTVQETEIKKASELIYECVKNDNIVHVFGTGHSHLVGVDMYARSGGLLNINAMLDGSIMPTAGAMRASAMEKVKGIAEIILSQYKISEGDIMIIVSNSGRNNVPIEMALLARKMNLKTIGITSLEHSKASPSNNKCGKNLYELVDIVLDNGTVSGDCALTVNGIKTGAISSISGMTLGNAIVVESIKLLSENKKRFNVYGNNNSVGGNSNEELCNMYKGRIKHI